MTRAHPLAGLLLAGLLTLVATPATRAQVAPSAAEMRAYDGWLRAAIEGDVPRLQKLIAAGLEVAEEGAFWLEEVRVATRSMLDLGALRARDDAVGRLVHAIEDLAADPSATAGPGEAARAYAGAMLDRGAGRLRQALGEDHPAVLAAEGRLPPELLRRARDLLLARLAQG